MNFSTKIDVLQINHGIVLIKILTVIVFLLVSSLTFSQNDDAPEKKHEIKANAFNLIVFKAADFSYEYLINDESSIGASMLFNLQDRGNDRDFEDGPYYQEKFAFTPFYRRYFSSKYAWGFFLEAFGMFNIQDEYDSYNYDYVYDPNISVNRDGTSTNVAFGISIGGKFVSKGGFAFEVFGGAGRNVYQSNEDYASEIVPRLGASLGYRF